VNGIECQSVLVFIQFSGEKPEKRELELALIQTASLLLQNTSELRRNLAST
jgi:hypothetical protein